MAVLEHPVGPATAEGLVAVDLRVDDGVISAIAPAGSAPEVAIACHGAIALPGGVDAHTHLDKGFTWSRAPNPDGSFAGALATIRADYQNWTFEDVCRRMEHGLQLAYAHGTVAIRTHLDSSAAIRETTWAAFDAVRDRWAGRITLQAASIVWLDAFQGDEGVAIANRVTQSGGVLGFVIQHEGPGPLPDWIAPAIDRATDLAAERGLDLDLHLDETLDARSTTLALVAERVVARAFKGQIQVGHCCALGSAPDADVKRTIQAVKDAGIAVVSLPLCNLYLQDRGPGRTPRARGVTLLHELAAAGVPVSLASDNTRDAFYAYGQLDLLEVLREGVRIGHLDHPFGAWPAAITRTPAEVMALPHAGRIAVGCPADLVLYNARSLNRLLADPHRDRRVLRRGQVLQAPLPVDPDAAFAAG
jgi:cytosine deaminase